MSGEIERASGPVYDAEFTEGQVAKKRRTVWAVVVEDGVVKLQSETAVEIGSGCLRLDAPSPLFHDGKTVILESEAAGTREKAVADFVLSLQLEMKSLMERKHEINVQLKSAGALLRV